MTTYSPSFRIPRGCHCLSHDDAYTVDAHPPFSGDRILRHVSLWPLELTIVRGAAGLISDSAVLGACWGSVFFHFFINIQQIDRALIKRLTGNWKGYFPAHQEKIAQRILIGPRAYSEDKSSSNSHCCEASQGDPEEGLQEWLSALTTLQSEYTLPLASTDLPQEKSSTQRGLHRGGTCHSTGGIAGRWRY